MNKKSIVLLLTTGLLCGQIAVSVSANELLADTLSSMAERSNAAGVDYEAVIPGKWTLHALGKTKDTVQEMSSENSFIEADHYYYTLTLEGNEVSSGLWQLIDEESGSCLFIPDNEETEEEGVYYSGNIVLNEETGEVDFLTVQMEGYYLFFEKENDDIQPSLDKTNMLGGTAEEIYTQIMSAEHITVDAAYTSLENVETTDSRVIQLKEELIQLQKCQGIYIQEQDENSTGKVYTATLNYYLVHGDVWGSVEYTNYSGALEDASVNPSEETEYIYVMNPEGQFYSNKSVFDIQISEEKLRIRWGDSCDYTLYRSDGSQNKLEDKTVPFEESETFKTITDLLDTYFEKMARHYVYNEEDNTVYAYIRIVTGLRNMILQNASAMSGNWQEVLDEIVKLSDRISAATTLATRDGFLDGSEAHCTIMIVDEVNDEDIYYKDDVIAIVTDGEITFDLLDDSLNDELPSREDSVSIQTETSVSEHSVSGYENVTAPNDIGTATIGEKNALRSAQSYLDYMAFSYTGLIDQLEYEGYSYPEAKYAVDHCGADWYEQAVKSAKSYLEYMPFSRSGLIEQLEYEGFTYDQAVYGVDQNGF